MTLVWRQTLLFYPEHWREPVQEYGVITMDTTDTAYRDLVEQQQDLIVKISLEGRLLFVNTAYANCSERQRTNSPAAYSCRSQASGIPT